jgi:hypothetical protein
VDSTGNFRVQDFFDNNGKADWESFVGRGFNPAEVRKLLSGLQPLKYVSRFSLNV